MYDYKARLFILQRRNLTWKVFFRVIIIRPQHLIPRKPLLHITILPGVLNYTLHRQYVFIGQAGYMNSQCCVCSLLEL